MRRAWLVSASFGVLLASGACATATVATQGQGQLDEAAPQVVSRTLSASERDSLFAQAYADRQGPRAWIYADAGSEAGARRVSANFHLDDDAYVVVGHLDADGILRIVFPANPSDDGFVKGDKTYMTNQFFAGFNDEYRYRAQEVSLSRGLTPKLDSYDGGLGYVFMIASWRPMRFEQFSSDGIWNRYELNDDQYLNDPRSAIQELASVLTGDNREAFTVQYARYYGTVSSAANYGSGFADGPNSGYCSGFNSIGSSLAPFSLDGLYGGGLGYSSLGLGYGTGGCFGSGRYGLANYGNGFGTLAPPPVVGTTPPIVTTPPKRVPQPLPPRHYPTTKSATPATPGQSASSPEYRRRGLITTDDGTRSGPERNSPRTQSHLRSEQSPRPGIEQMINRRAEAADNYAGGANRGNSGNGGNMAWAHNRSNQDENGARPVPVNGQARSSQADRYHAGTRNSEPRSAQPRVDHPHVEQAPRAATARAASPPPAAPAAQSTKSSPTPSRP